MPPGELLLIRDILNFSIILDIFLIFRWVESTLLSIKVIYNCISIVKSPAEEERRIGRSMRRMCERVCRTIF